MLFIHDTAQWLDDVDPWTDREALDLFEAARACRSQGLFHCVSAAGGGACFVMTALAAAVLVLDTREAWQAFVLEVGRRYGLATPMLVEPVDTAQGLPKRAAANDRNLPPVPAHLIELPRFGKAAGARSVAN